jgi:hypothetical protein
MSIKNGRRLEFKYEGTSANRATKYSDFSCCLVCLSSQLIVNFLCLVALEG